MGQSIYITNIDTLTNKNKSSDMDKLKYIQLIPYQNKEKDMNYALYVTMFKAITKWSWSIRNADSIPEIIRRAFKISLKDKAGAVHLVLPHDIAKEKSDIKPITTQELSRPKPDHKLVDIAAKMIAEAEKPLLLLGNGVIRGNAAPSLRRFVEKTGICSMNTFMAKGIISDKSERHLQTIGIKEADHAQIAIKEADLVVAVGYDLVEYSPKNWNRDLKKKIIHIDFTYAEVDTYYPPVVEIAADIEYTIDAILDELEKKKRENPGLDDFPHYRVPHLFRKIKQEIVWRIERFNNDFSYPIKPERLLLDVRNALGENDIVISDVGAHKLWIAKVYNTFSPNTCIITNGMKPA